MLKIKKEVFASNGLEYARIKMERLLKVHQEVYDKNQEEMFEGAPVDHATCRAIQACLGIIEEAESWDVQS
jgi:hypothetical protein